MYEQDPHRLLYSRSTLTHNSISRQVSASTSATHQLRDSLDALLQEADTVSSLVVADGDAYSGRTAHHHCLIGCGRHVGRGQLPLEFSASAA